MTRMTMTPLRASISALAGLVLLAAPALAQPKADPDWPCVQRKVATLSPGMLWRGPDIAAAGEWGDDSEAAQLARKIASRRTELSEVDPLLDAFAEKAGPDRDKRLTRVFAGVFEVVNGERDKVMGGIGRYAQGQRRMAERIRDEADKVSQTKDAPSATDARDMPKEQSELETRFNWDRRIFQERSHSLQYVCEVPQLLEQRLGELGRRIQARLQAKL